MGNESTTLTAQCVESSSTRGGEDYCGLYWPVLRESGIHVKVDFRRL